MFQLSEYPAEAYAASLGLPGAPQIKMLDQAQKNKSRAASKAVEPVVVHQRLASMEPSDDEDESGSEDEEESDGSGSEDDGSDASGSSSGSEDAPLVSLRFDHC